MRDFRLEVVMYLLACTELAHYAMMDCASLDFDRRPRYHREVPGGR